MHLSLKASNWSLTLISLPKAVQKPSKGAKMQFNCKSITRTARLDLVPAAKIQGMVTNVQLWGNNVLNLILPLLIKPFCFRYFWLEILPWGGREISER